MQTGVVEEYIITVLQELQHVIIGKAGVKTLKREVLQA
jgi:hypothetical protein